MAEADPSRSDPAPPESRGLPAVGRHDGRLDESYGHNAAIAGRVALFLPNDA